MTNIHILRIKTKPGTTRRDDSLIKFLKDTADNHTNSGGDLVLIYSEFPLHQRNNIEIAGWEYIYTRKSFVQLTLF